MHRRVIATLTTALLLIAAGEAPAASTPAADFDLRLTSQDPGTATALTLHIVYRNPSNPAAKPPGLRQVVIEAPPGTQFDGTVVPACAAGDAELFLTGAAACRSATRVGSGTVTALTGFGAPVDPIAADVVLFNAGTGTINVFSAQGTGATLVVDRPRFTAPNTITDTPPVIAGGPPDFETTVREVNFRFDEIRGVSGVPYVTTPRECPAIGPWTSKLTYLTADGQTYGATSTTPCRPVPLPARRRARIRVSVAPRRVAVGHRVRIRVRLRSTSARCKRGATVRVGGRRVRTDARGRATLRVRFRTTGRHRVTATRRGCRAGAASIVAVRRRT